MYRPPSVPASDNSPIAVLYQAYAHRLLAYAHRHTATREDAEDIVLEVFVAALESNVLLLRSEGEQSAWLWRVIYNKVADYSRQRMRRTAAPLEEVAQTVSIDDEQAPDQVALRTEEYAELRACLKLSKRYSGCASHSACAAPKLRSAFINAMGQFACSSHALSTFCAQCTTGSKEEMYRMNNQHNSDNDDEQFTPDAVDQQIDALLLPNAPLQQQHADARVLHDLAALYMQDAASLERISERLSEHSAFADANSQGEEAQRFHIDGRTSEKTLDHENTLQGQRDGSGSMQRNAEQRKRSTVVRILSSLAAVIIVGALVGSWALVTHLAVHQTTQTKPAVVTKKPVEPLGTIQMLNTTTGWAVAAANNRVLRTTDGGTSWKDVTPKYPANAALTPVGIGTDFLSGDLAWVAVSQIAKGNTTYPSTVFRTVDGGQTWQSSMLPNNELGVSQVSFVDAQNGWVISSLGGGAAGSEAVDIFHTTDGGKTWVRVTHVQPTSGSNAGALPLGGDKSGFSFVNASTGWAAGFTPVDNFVWLYVTHDSGITWQHQTLPFPANRATAQVETMPPVFFTANDGILLATFETPNGKTPSGSSSYYYVTHDGGLTWGSPRQPPVFVSTSPSFIDTQHGWVIGGDSTTLYTTHDGGQHWTKIIPGSNFKNVYLLDFVSTETGWAIGGTDPNTTFLLKTENGGHTWTQINYQITR